MRRRHHNRKGVSSLEKIFLGVMALFSSMILVMFSLYFDVADMFRGGLIQSAHVSVSAYDRLRDEAYRAGARKEILPFRLGNAEFGIPSDRGQFIGNAYLPFDPRLRARIVAATTRRLKRRGVKSPELLSLLAKGAYRFEVSRVLREADRAVEDLDFEAAAQILEKALGNTERDNLLIIHELLQKLAEVYFLHLKDFAKGRATTKRLRDVDEEIRRIRGLG